MKFQPGDIVRLKAPRMTVESVNGEDINTKWMEGEQVRTGSFHISSLDRVEAGDHVRFISEEEDANPSGLETSCVTNRVDQLANSRSLAKTAKDTIEAFRKPPA